MNQNHNDDNDQDTPRNTDVLCNIDPHTITQYYAKYTRTITLTYSKQLPLVHSDRLKTLELYMIKLYSKLYGKRNIHDMNFDYYAVLETKDKYSNSTHWHWHVLLNLPNNKKHHALTQEYVDNNTKWQYGNVHVVEEQVYTPHKYITDYLSKHDDSYHYIRD